MFKKINFTLTSIIILAFLLTGCAAQKAENSPQKELQKITISLDWTPNTNHTGLYVAKDKGFYKELGLDVEIIQPAGGTAEQLVAADKAQFGVSYQESVTLARLENVPVVSIAAVIQHNTSGFGSLKTKNIVTPKDFEGKSYGGWGSPIEKATLKALMEKEGADSDKVNIVTSGASDFFASSEKDIDFFWIFEGWTGIEAKIKGIELNYIDLGKENPALDYYTPVLITNEKNIKENKELVQKFMDATTKGYQYAIQNPDDAAQVLLKNAPELNAELVKESQKFLSGKYQDDASQWGLQKKEVWENYAKWLLERDLIPKMLDVEASFTNEFLPKK